MTEKVLDWNSYKEAALTCASEGIVLLKNDGSLPFAEGMKIAMFGRAQNHYYKSGTGSGGMVNVSHITDIREGLEGYRSEVIQERLKSRFLSKRPGLTAKNTAGLRRIQPRLSGL